MLALDKSGLFNGIDFIRAADIGGSLQSPELVVLHYTAGASWDSDLRSLTTKDEREASAHFLVGRAGELAQMVPVNRVAWHAGKSAWNGRNACNRFSIGIEISNWGPLVQREGKYWAWPGNFEKTDIPEERVIAGRHKNPSCSFRFWEEYSYACRSTLEMLLLSLFSALPSLRALCGHEDVSPGRKIDPGPALDVGYFRKTVSEKIGKEIQS